MEYLVILGLAGWVWLQRQRINALSRRIGALEVRVRALAAEREPLVLDTPIATPPAEAPLLLDTLTPEPSNDTAPLEEATESSLPGPWFAWAILSALYVWFGFELARNNVMLALAIVTGAALAAVLLGAIPAAITPPSWRSTRAAAPGIALSVSAVALIWVWPAVAPSSATNVAGPSLAAAFLVTLAAYGARKRWVNMSAFAVVALTIVFGVAGYIRGRASLASLDDPYYAWALILAFAVAAGVIAARPSHRDRAIAAFGGALGAGGLIALAAFSRPAWPTLSAWAPLIVGAIAFGLAALRASRAASAPLADGAVTWWAGAACVLALIGVHAVAPPPLTTLVSGALALTLALASARTSWHVLSLGTTSAAALAVLHGLSDVYGALQLGLPAPWSALAILGATAALLYAAARSVGDRPLSADALRTASWAVGMTAVFLAFDQLGDFDSFTGIALRGLALLVAGHLAAARQDADVSILGRWLGPAFIVGGLILILAGCGWSLNPWWGEAPAPIAGGPILNSQTLAFLLSAVLTLGAAGRWFDRAPRFARWCLAVSVALVLVWLTLEIRRFFHGATMASSRVGLAEAACYALVTLGVVLMLRTRDDRERFARLAHRAYERIAGGQTPPLPSALPPQVQPPGARRERRRGRR